jgi:Arc/MetJ family transcription regulator
MHKRTNIEIDTELMAKAMKMTHKKTIKDVVNYSLQQVIEIEKRKNLLKLKGKVKWEGDLDEMRTV